MTFRTALATGTVAAIALPAAAQPNDLVNAFDYQLNVEVVAGGLEHPWGLAFIDDERFIVTERNPGDVRIGTIGGELSDPLDGSPEVFRPEGETERSQAGLFDVKLHPDFDENGLLFLAYARPTERGAAMAIDRARLVEGDAGPALTEVETIFVMQEEDQDASALHFGGRMVIDPEDDSLYLTIGERRNISRSQDAEDQAGSILRMTLDGEPHPDAPFLDEDEANEYIFAWGVRNPQALAFGPDGSFWYVDHGPDGGDEINLIEAGNNYGWPFITGGTDYSGAPLGVGLEHEGMTSPIHVFDQTIAPSGLGFAEGDLFPAWEGNMLIGGLVAEGLVRVTMDGQAISDEEVIELGRRIRDVQVHPDGAIWLLTEHSDGEVLRLTPGEG